MFANFGGEREHVLERHSLLKRPLAGALDDRAIGERIAEGDTQFNHTRTRVDGGGDDFASRREVGVAAGYVGDERWLIFKMKGHGYSDAKRCIFAFRLPYWFPTSPTVGWYRKPEWVNSADSSALVAYSF